ncbi:hypothetical protein EJB05_29309, partial [Eragrostis curvula]
MSPTLQKTSSLAHIMFGDSASPLPPSSSSRSQASAKDNPNSCLLGSIIHIRVLATWVYEMRHGTPQNHTSKLQAHLSSVQGLVVSVAAVQGGASRELQLQLLLSPPGERSEANDGQDSDTSSPLSWVSSNNNPASSRSVLVHFMVPKRYFPIRKNCEHPTLFDP